MLHKRLGHDMSTFYENFLAQCTIKKVSPSQAAEAIGLSRASTTGWKRGAIPSDANINRLADYFGCDVADLTGKSFVSAGGKAHWKGSGVSVVVPGQSRDDEMAEELQLLRDREELKALLHIGARNTPEQVRRFVAFLESTNYGSGEE